MKALFTISNTIKQFNEVEEKYELEIRKRIKLLINMDAYIRLRINNEELFYTWIMIVPDEATLEDYEDLAVEDESYFGVCELFSKLILLDIKKP